jgi:methionyl-tRNA synthetase
MKPYYLTTPIYYVNDAPHLGHTYTTLFADTIKRFKRMQGYDAFLLTGTDEHGQKVERSARAAGKEPKAFVDSIANEYKKSWDRLGIAYDQFIRTTEPRHHETVRWLFERCKANGYVYNGTYTGQYCVSDELYVNDAKPGDPCPDCGRPTETVTEDNYFFKLSAFTDRLLELYEKNPLFIQPDTRRNEVISFVKQGLQDLSISRTSIHWGIPLPVEGRHVAYVWFDALTNYLTVGRETGRWPAQLHLIGKEIVRFHAIFWPAYLMAAGVPLPERVFAHGHLMFQNMKMSKSRGNMVRAEPIRQAMGAEGLRYFLAREIVFGQDGNFSYEALIGRYNSDLANGLGNLASRTLTMIQQYNQGVIPPRCEAPELRAEEAVAAAVSAYDELAFSRALEAVWALIGEVDRMIVQKAPWKLVKQPGGRPELEATLYTAAEALRIVTALASPVLPESCAKIWAQLGMTTPLDSVRVEDLKWGGLAAGQKTGKVEGVFPRLDIKDLIPKLEALEAEAIAAQAVLMGRAPARPAAAEEEKSGKIGIEDFGKVDMRVGVVVSAERVKGADKLLHLKVDIGEAEPRTIVAGIAEAYAPEQMLNRKVAIVANLAPRKLRGIESNGMILAASVEGGKPVLAGFLEDIAPGARLK